MKPGSCKMPDSHYLRMFVSACESFPDGIATDEITRRRLRRIADNIDAKEERVHEICYPKGRAMNGGPHA